MKEKYDPLEMDVIVVDYGNVVTSSPNWGEEIPIDDDENG